MARTFVYSDNQAARVELIDNPETGHWRAYCEGCTPGYSRYDPEADLLRDSRERYALEDAAQVASVHVDRCRRCADPGCRTPGRHDAGHRCRKA